MASQDSTLVSAAKPASQGGVSYAAPTGSTLPVDVTTALDAAFVKHGYISDDGLKNVVNKETDDIVAFGGDVVLTVTKSRKETFELTFIQSLDPEVQKEVYGADNVAMDVVTGLTTIRHNALELPHRAFVFEVLMTGDKIKRIVVGDGKVTEVGDVEYKDGAPIGYPVTVTTFPSADLEGDTAREYIGARV